MTDALSCSPVSIALKTALNVAGLTGVVSGKTGSVGDDVLQTKGLDWFLLYEVSEGPDPGGLGTKAGSVGRVRETRIRLSVFSQYGGMKECQAVMNKAILLLADAPTVTGWGSWAIFWDDTIPVGDSLVGGVKVKELVTNGRLYCEAQ